MVKKKSTAPGGNGGGAGGSKDAAGSASSPSGLNAESKSPRLVAVLAGDPPKPDWVGFRLKKGGSPSQWVARIYTSHGATGEEFRLSTGQLTSYPQFQIRGMLAAVMPLPALTREQWRAVLNTALTILRFEERHSPC